MIVGIVGADAAKFNEVSQAWARRRIAEVFMRDQPSLVVSGRCPKGGVDIWSIQEATRVGIPTREYPPEDEGWKWYKARNIQIAEASDKVVCIAARWNPRGITFPNANKRPPYCAHCAKSGEELVSHVQSGGCWTMHYARELGKRWQLIVVGSMPV